MSDICSGCGADVRRTGHYEANIDENGMPVWCPVVEASLMGQATQSSLRPPPRTSHNADTRQGVVHQSASSAVTYTTESRGRGCRLNVDPALLKPGAGTMTRAEYDIWQETH